MHSALGAAARVQLIPKKGGEERKRAKRSLYAGASALINLLEKAAAVQTAPEVASKRPCYFDGEHAALQFFGERGTRMRDLVEEKDAVMRDFGL